MIWQQFACPSSVDANFITRSFKSLDIQILSFDELSDSIQWTCQKILWPYTVLHNGHKHWYVHLYSTAYGLLSLDPDNAHDSINNSRHLPGFHVVLKQTANYIGVHIYYQILSLLPLLQLTLYNVQTYICTHTYTRFGSLYFPFPQVKLDNASLIHHPFFPQAFAPLF